MKIFMPTTTHFSITEWVRDKIEYQKKANHLDWVINFRIREQAAR